MKECEPLAAPTTYTRVDDELEIEVEGPEIAVDVPSFDALIADVVVLDPDEELEIEVKGSEIVVDVPLFDVLIAGAVVLDPVPKLNDSAEVGAAPEVGEVRESELCPVAVFEGLLISLFTTQHDGVPSGWRQQYCSSGQPP
jgi:hypothetical protein